MELVTHSMWQTTRNVRDYEDDEELRANGAASGHKTFQASLHRVDTSPCDGTHVRFTQGSVLDDYGKWSIYENHTRATKPHMLHPRQRSSAPNGRRSYDQHRGAGVVRPDLGCE